jgi:hypothetical protein
MRAIDDRWPVARMWGELKRHIVHINDEVSQPILPTPFGLAMMKRS